MSILSPLRYALAALVDRAGWRAQVALTRVQRAWVDAPTAIGRAGRKIAASITPCGCNPGGWEMCSACDHGERPAQAICACHRGEA